MIINGVEHETGYTKAKATSSSVSKRAVTSSNWNKSREFNFQLIRVSGK